MIQSPVRRAPIKKRTTNEGTNLGSEIKNEDINTGATSKKQ